MASTTDTFRLRLNCIDHYQSPPCSLDPTIWGPHALFTSQRNNLPQVPVIRVFGATETGQKVCAHIHGAFPYLYIPYTESAEKSHVESYISTFRQSTDHALALSYRRNPYDNPRNATFVAHISLVKGVPFFGYNVGYRYYLKIYLLNPSHMTRFADLLQQGAILKQFFQPHEAHLQYLLQWMCDFNLYGCAFIETHKPHFRNPVPSWEDLDDHTHIWHDRSIPKESIREDEGFPRQSYCQIEVDICVEDILNRHSVQARPLHQSFLERLESLENLPPEEKLVHSMAGLWKDETRRRKLRMGLTDPSSSPFPPEVLISMSADPRNDSEGGWIHEEEFRAEIAKLAELEKRTSGGGNLSFESFHKLNPEDDGVQSVLESVEELFQSNLEVRWNAKMQQADADYDEYNDEFIRTADEEEFKNAAVPLMDLSGIERVAQEEDYGSDEELARTQALAQREEHETEDIETHTRRNATFEDTNQIKTENHLSQGSETSLEGKIHGPLKQVWPGGSQSPSKKFKFNSDGAKAPTKHSQFRVKDVRMRKPVDGHVADPRDNLGSLRAEKTNKREILEDPVTKAPPSAQRASSQPSSQGSKLGFPVVKSGPDEEVSLRLSQRDDLAHISLKNFQQKRKDGLTMSSNESHKSRSTDLSMGSSKYRASLDQKLVTDYVEAFELPATANVFCFGAIPPTFDEVESTVSPPVIYQDAYYSSEKDVPERSREYAGQEFRLESNTLPYLPVFDKTGERRLAKNALDKASTELAEQRRKNNCSLKVWEIMQPPPTWDEVDLWMEDERDSVTDEEISSINVDGPPRPSQLKRKNRPAPELSQIDGPTQKNRYGFKYSQKKTSTSVQHETGYMSVMSLEVHANSRGDLAPDPEKDEINAIVWSVADEKMDSKAKLGVLVLSKEEDDHIERVRHIVGEDTQLDSEVDELDLLNRLVDIVREYDPDILTGFEVHNSSWGYLIERGRLKYEFNLTTEFARVKSQSHGRFGKDADRWGFTHTSTVSITGRHTINIWRAMRSELNLLQYTMENVVFHVLHRRIPHYSFRTLTKWYQSPRPRDLAKLLDYFITRTKLDMEILNANELIPRTSEQARLLGVDFFSVFSRGSQFKVESLMFRIAKPESFVLVSPSRKQVGAQNALECLPLVMEPQSAFYSSPLLVLDFQSLYPSIMIAYNYCYSTCLGRIVNWRGTNKLGFADFQRAPGLLELVQDKLNISPNGMMFVKPEMRKSLLAKMLGEILESRVMVKSGMKVDKDDKTLQQLLNNRQLALKLIANVTYGYTSASFSGRMPCAEIADSIVQTARETLEKAIAFIHSVERWGAEVVYGDTDSLFVYLKGRTRAQAFEIGEEISKAVTDLNPRPVKLKFEKVYHPCVLLAKKRYVGFKYESLNQTEPDFDAKGIETVRRDGTPAEQKIEETALKLLFRTSDLSEVKRYFQAQCTKIMSGRISVQDFCFAKEVKLGTYADKGPPPPGALIATRRMLRDPRTEPQYGERVPYVVIAGAPGARLFERCVEPERLINDENTELDAEYYISKNLIPPLERIFNLVGANVRQWYDEMPKVQRIRMLGGPKEGDAFSKSKRTTMESYMGSSLCLVCRTKLLPATTAGVAEPELPLCRTCRHVNPCTALLTLRKKMQNAEKRVRDIEDVCRSCSGLAWDEKIRCDSRDCPIFYSRVKAHTQLRIAERGTGNVLKIFEHEEAKKMDYDW